MTTAGRIIETIAREPGITYRELRRRMAPLGWSIVDPILRSHLERGTIAADLNERDREASTFRLANGEATR